MSSDKSRSNKVKTGIEHINESYEKRSGQRETAVKRPPPPPQSSSSKEKP